jgi:hypothetical protein
MSETRWRLAIDFESLDDVRSFADSMAERTQLPTDAVIRVMDATDTQAVTPAHRLIWGLRDQAFEGTLVWPELDREVELRALRQRVRDLEAR